MLSTEPGGAPVSGRREDGRTYLDAIPEHLATVGYGRLGRNGELGYEGRSVSVRGRRYEHALSTHPPARLVYRIDRRYGRFTCQVALNDDVPWGRSHADFAVLADHRLVATAPRVQAGEEPRALSADIRGARVLELVVSTSRWEFAHAVWLDPVLDQAPVAAGTQWLLDCLGRAEIALPDPRPRATRCIATVVSPGYAGMLDDMLGSLLANGGCQDALIVIFAIAADAACAQVAAKYRSTLIPCTAQARVNPTLKSILYSVARVVDADQFLCLDADTLILGDLRPLFAALEASPSSSIFACAEGNGSGGTDLAQALRGIYGGDAADLTLLLGTLGGEGAYPLIVNDGLFASSREALLALDALIRQWPEAPRWVDARRDIWWRNQFVFNLALARLRCGVELDGSYNVQLHVQDVALAEVNGRLRADWRGRPARVLHFGGSGRRKYPTWRGRFAQAGEPLVGTGGGDGYGDFLAALRTWIGQQGLGALAWSFYGTADARGARVPDPAMLPVLARLHYLIRANGAVRVLETGTARGVSAACLASAVAHRAGGRVVTMDPYPHGSSTTLWAALPPAMTTCIEQRVTGSLEGMRAALAAGERFEAALLDSVHTEEHVWAEFQLAAQLVCRGGLILIHDATYRHGTVDQALQRIKAAGYGVVRLGTAETGEPEEDGLGLAVIENSRRDPSGVSLVGSARERTGHSPG